MTGSRAFVQGSEGRGWVVGGREGGMVGERGVLGDGFWDMGAFGLGMDGGEEGGVAFFGRQVVGGVERWPSDRLIE